MKNILITGVSSGIGYATATELLDKGFFVFGSVRSSEDAQRLEKNFGSNFKALLFDVREGEAIAAAFKVVKEMVGSQGLHGLVNNAGMAITGPLLHLEINEFEKQMAINLTGVLKVIQAFAPLLGASLSSPFPPGRIINISSVAGKITTPFMVPYAASKHALESLSDGLRRELSIYNIKVILIEPGPIKTEIWKKVINEKKDYGHTDYANILNNMEAQVQKSAANAIPAERVAKLIHRALILNRPKLRYLIAPNQFFISLATLLPHRVLDFFIFKQLKKALS
ncbi:MAG: SDR family oxidoreductase [Saprospiraceae bacterium]